MRATTTFLILGLALSLAFGVGVTFDRWLHRPISAGGFTVAFPTASLIPRGAAPAPKPIPPCMIDCVPDDQHSDGVVEPEEDETQASCYGNGSIPCPGAGPKLHPYGYWPWDREYCHWFNLCQQET